MKHKTNCNNNPYITDILYSAIFDKENINRQHLRPPVLAVLLKGKILMHCSLNLHQNHQCFPHQKSALHIIAKHYSEIHCVLQTMLAQTKCTVFVILFGCQDFSLIDV